VTPGDEDARLRAAMSEAHRQDPAQTPRFEAVWSSARRSRPHRSTWRWALVPTAIVAVAAVIWLVSRPTPVPPTWPTVETRWVAPTDFLLVTPDLITLRSLPTLDPATDPWTVKPPEPRGLP
jgi:hypothetical protein